MMKFIITYWDFDNHNIIVNAKDEKEAFIKFIYALGNPYPLDIKDVENMLKDFDTEKFIRYFENEYSVTVYGIYEIYNTLFEKEIEEE